MDDSPRIKQARELARAYLTKHSIAKPPTPIEDIIKKELLRIVRRPWGKNSVVGALLFRKQRVIALNADDSPRRQRFSLAHELGHYAFNHDTEKAEWLSIDIDHPPDEPEFYRTAETNQHGNKVCEQEANAFASEILVPKKSLLALRPKPAKSNPEEEPPFNRPFAALAKKPQHRLSIRDLIDVFDVSEEVVVLALGKHGVL